MNKTSKSSQRWWRTGLIWLTVVTVLCIALEAKQPESLYFDVKDLGEPDEGVPVIKPWRTVQLDGDYGGQWVVAGDLDGDGAVEIVSCENINNNDVHYTSTAVAQKLDGSVLWCWGNPRAGRKNWHHDVACQIHDWDGDGRNEVVLCTKGAVVELDGRTGKERRRIKIAEDASDCLVFCNLSGGESPTDILVKDRYHRIWAYDRHGKLLWSVTDPGGYRTAHQPRPMDLDGDGRDEIMAGYAMLNHDGAVRWVFKSKKVDQGRGHLDCARIYRKGATPEEFRIVLTCCGANNIAMIDGAGKTLWEVSGYHFESIDVGKILPDGRGPQIVVDIDHRPLGESPLWVLDRFGNLLGQIVSDYCRHHCLLDWTGDGVSEILVSHNGALYDHKGRRIGTFTTPGEEPSAKGETSMLIGDMTGDGVPDVMIATTNAVYIYKNTKGKKQPGPVRLGTEFNFTLY
ncbi:MAG: hypothetical protein ISS79_10020 [Phycisphaerae bacterium]|nr:hypothetical protein [Phycisphaerae bacterium]